MRIFYSKKTKEIIATPFLCGSTFFKNNYGLLNLQNIDISKYKILLGSELRATFDIDIQQQFIFYRNPFDRYISWVNKFAYKRTQVISSAFNDSSRNIIVKNPNDFWKVASWFVDFIEKNKDGLNDHFVPQIKLYQEYIENDFQIPVNWLKIEDSYTKFVTNLINSNCSTDTLRLQENKQIALTALMEYEPPEILKQPLTANDVYYAYRVAHKIEELYQDDYRFFRENGYL